MTQTAHRPYFAASIVTMFVVGLICGAVIVAVPKADADTKPSKTLYLTERDIYVFVDPEYGCQYLVQVGGRNTHAGRGGMTARMQYGSPARGEIQVGCKRQR